MTMTMAQAVRIIDLTMEELANLIKQAVGAKQCPPCKEPEPEVKLFYTREETSKMLNISISTLHNHRKAGTLVPMKAKGRVLYPREAIMNFVRMSA
ncbi:helix-turn-helix domain-containing protein [Flavobacterium hauense]